MRTVLRAPARPQRDAARPSEPWPASPHRAQAAAALREVTGRCARAAATTLTSWLVVLAVNHAAARAPHRSTARLGASSASSFPRRSSCNGRPHPAPAPPLSAPGTAPLAPDAGRDFRRDVAASRTHWRCPPVALPQPKVAGATPPNRISGLRPRVPEAQEPLAGSGGARPSGSRSQARWAVRGCGGAELSSQAPKAGKTRLAGAGAAPAKVLPEEQVRIGSSPPLGLRSWALWKHRKANLC